MAKTVQTRSFVAQTGRFLRQLHLFFGSPDEVGRLRDFEYEIGRFWDNRKNEKIKVQETTKISENPEPFWILIKVYSVNLYFINQLSRLVFSDDETAAPVPFVYLAPILFAQVSCTVAPQRLPGLLLPTLFVQ